MVNFYTYYPHGLFMPDKVVYQASVDSEFGHLSLITYQSGKANRPNKIKIAGRYRNGCKQAEWDAYGNST
jgi:hypothetical protein